MAEKRNEYSFMNTWLTGLGYKPDIRMADVIESYWGWFVGDNDFYHYKKRKGFFNVKMERRTLHPAFIVSDSWADLLMTEGTTITSDDSGMQEFIDEVFDDFALDNADMLTRAFALGTGAWALNFRDVDDSGMVHPDAVIDIVDYDATQILPITWGARDCTQCAFASRVEYNGKDYDQCQAHVLRGGTYHILTQLFDVDTHKPVYADGIINDFNTGSPYPTFALVRPATTNTHYANCAMGASVFDKAIDAIRSVDEAFTSFTTHLRVGLPKIFVAETMIKREPQRDSDGNVIGTTYSAFGEADDIVFRTAPGSEGSKDMNVVQPDLKVDENTEAINAALKMLGTECGFGSDKFSWDKESGGVKTAREVISNNSEMARKMRKHQKQLRRAIITLIRGAAGAYSAVQARALNPDADITVDFDDSIMVDTETEKNMDLTEIGALGVDALKIRYLVKWKGYTPEEAAAVVPSVNLIDEGF